MFTYLELISFAFQGHLLELLGRLGAGVNRKYLVRSTKFVHVYLLRINFFLFLHFKVTSLNFRTFGAGGSEIVLPCFNGHLGVKVIKNN